MILHTISAVPGDSCIQQCLQVLAQGDALLLLGDGVYAGMQGTLTDVPCPIYALAEDLSLTGIKARLDNSIQTISMGEFVALTVKAQSQVAWY